jgi:hypothetical protein
MRGSAERVVIAVAMQYSEERIRRNGGSAAHEVPEMICSHTNPLPDPLADPTRDPERDPLTPPSPGHHNEEPQRPEGPPSKDPVSV